LYIDAPFLLDNVGSAPQVTLYLTISLSKRTSSSMPLVSVSKLTSSRFDSALGIDPAAKLPLIGELSSPHMSTQAEVPYTNAEKALQV
jgi:hypothetical protein